MNLVCINSESVFVKDKENLLIGEWCLSNDINLSKYKFDIFSNCQSFNEIDRNFLITQNIYKFFFKKFYDFLNKVHCINEGEQFWSILLGEWFDRFIKVVVFRYSLLENIFSHHNISSFVNISNDEVSSICKNTHYFINISNDPLRSNRIYFELINFFNKDVKIINKKNNDPISSLSIKLKKFPNLFVDDNEPFISQTYLSKINQIKLHLSLKRLPRFWHVPEEIFVENDDLLREKLSKQFFFNLSLNSNWSKDEIKILYFLHKKIFIVLPNSLLKGFNLNYKYTDKLKLPKNPKFIFTSNFQTFHELFRFYAAKKNSLSSKIIYGQHGCNYGVAKYHANSTACEKSSTYFFTWGWKQAKNNIPMPMFFSIKKNKNYSKKALLIFNCFSGENYPYNNYLITKNTMSKSLEFLGKVNNELKKNIICKFHNRNDSYNLYLKKKFSKQITEIDNKIKIVDKKNINDLRKISRISIHGYEGTSFLEDLNANRPFICILQNDLSFVRDEVRSIFEELIKYGVIFEKAALAADKFNRVFLDTDNWWNDRDLQKTLSNARFTLARYSKNPHQEIFDFLKKI